MAQVVQFPALSDMAKAVQTDNTNLTNLGSQINQVAHQYNQLKQQLMANPDANTRTQFAALLEQRRAAMQAIWDNIKQADATLRQKAAANGIAIDAQLPSVTLQGFGQLVDTSTIQTAITNEQTKLTALQTYYTAYQQAVEAGNQPPPLPAELQGGALGMSGTTILLGLGLVFGAMYFFKGK